MKKWLMIGVVVVCGALVASAGELWSVGADAAPALRVKSSAGDLSVIVTDGGTNLTVTVDGHENAIASVTNIADFTLAFVGCTNASGKKLLTVDAGCALSTDTLLAKILNGTYTASENQWLEIPWDTSECKFYQIYLPAAKVMPGISRLKVTRIVGEPTGTGDVTVQVFVDKEEKDRRVFESPVYVLSDTSTNTAVNTVNIDIPVEITKGASQSVLIRATRETTATTGLLGVNVE